MSSTALELPESTSDTAAWSTPQRKVLAGLLGLMVLFQITTLRPGHDWGGDFAQYLSHARNLATLRPYADTGYVYNPDAPEIGPPAYPPVFPLLLAPLVGLYGADFVVLKVAMLILFLGSLMVGASLFARRLSAWGTIATVAVWAYCPVFWEFNHQILSEHLFVFWWLLAMWLYGRHREAKEPLPGHPRGSEPTELAGASAVRAGTLLGVVLFLAMGTRTVGMVLPLAVLVTEAIRWRRLTGYAMTAVGVAMVLHAVQVWMVPSGVAGYLDQLPQISVRRVLSNLYADVVSFSYVWRNGRWEWLREGAGIAFALVACVGLLRANWPRPAARLQLLAVASCFYFVLVVVWPSAAWTRMIWPLLPGFLFWIVYAIEHEPAVSRWSKRLLTGFVLFTLASYAAWYLQADYSRISGPEDVAAQELFAEVRSQVAEDEVTLFFKPRVMALFAGRPAVGLPQGDRPEAIVETLRRHQVTWAVVGPDEASQALPAVLASQPFAPVWQNAAFELWRRDSKPGENDQTRSR